MISKKLRIAFVYFFFWPNVGGIEIPMYEYARGLVKRGHEVTVLTTKALNFKPASLVSSEIRDGIRIKRYGMLPSPFKYAFFAPRFFFDLFRLKVDVLQLFSLLPSFFILMPTLVARLSRTPVVMHPIFNPDRSRYRNIWIRTFDRIFLLSIGSRLLRMASHIIAITENEVRYCQQAGAKEVTLLYQGVSVIETSPEELDALRRKLSLNKKDFVLLSVGRIEKRKGFDFLISTLPIVKLRFPHVKLLIVGSDWGYLDKCRELARRLGCDGQVAFAGSLTVRELACAYRIAELVVIPSLFEGQSRIVLEAYAYRKPLVTTTMVGPRELIRSGGLQVKYGDVDGLAGAISYLLHDTQKRASLGERGFDAVRDLTWESRALKLEEVYEEVLWNSSHEGVRK